MITKKEFKIITGTKKDVQRELNKLNKEGVINIIHFNTNEQRDMAGSMEIVYYVHTALVHVGPFKDGNDGI